jgi:RNase H-fold protein (predicted Holliday junction resolvase)
MVPGTPDKYQLREIERQLAHELQVAGERLRTAPAEERAKSSEYYNRCLKAFTDFCTKKAVPERFFSQVA